MPAISFTILLQLKATVTNIDKAVLAISKEHTGLSVNQLLFLDCVDHDSETCERDIAALIGVSKSAVSQIGSDLLGKKLITTSENQLNRRKKNLKLTPKGQAALTAVRPELLSLAEALGTSITQQHIDTLGEVLTQINSQAKARST
jgi:DNA-binding MarR family transcriptional regulator